MQYSFDKNLTVSIFHTNEYTITILLTGFY